MLPHAPLCFYSTMSNGSSEFGELSEFGEFPLCFVISLDCDELSEFSELISESLLSLPFWVLFCSLSENESK